ncbi:MAG: trypsin-like peptidase domain-containing protein, partial [Bdellovibrionales bacterium]
MQRLLSAFLTIIFVQISSLSYAGTPPESFADLSEKLLPSVVNISSTQKVEEAPELDQLPEFPEGSPFQDFFEQFLDRRNTPFSGRPPASLGSGFVIDAEKGYIVTNNHVIADADKVHVILHNDEKLDATIIGRDEKTDIAVLQVKTDKPLTAVTFGQSDPMRVGDWVLAIGNPFGLGGTVTAGIISARQRNIHAGPYDDFIQTDASINKGNSGGPMLNSAGEVIGVVSSKVMFSDNIGYVVPINQYKIVS